MPIKHLFDQNWSMPRLIWDPHSDTRTQINQIEKVQRRAARYVTNRYHNTSSVTDMLQNLNWPSLEITRTRVGLIILTTNWAACVCVRKIWPISSRTVSFWIQTFRKFCSNSKIPIRCLWTAFCVPLSFIFYEKQWFRIQIITLRRSCSPLCGR